MKKIIFSAFLLLGISCFSQTATKKYNSINRRYEYFDSRGNMTGYEIYNTLTRQWEYYSTTSQQRSLNQYRDPIPLDITPLGNATTTLQNRYNQNTQWVQQEISKMFDAVYSLDIYDNQKNQIIETFKNSPLKSVNSQRINYSNINECNRVLNYLKESLSTIIKNVTASNSNNTPQNSSSNDYDSDRKIIANYGKTLPVYNIALFNYNNKRIKDEIIKSDSYIVINSDRILFKKADGELMYRDLRDKVYNERKRGYQYSSSMGGVFIHEDLKYVEFFEGSLALGENYTYYITSSANR